MKQAPHTDGGRLCDDDKPQLIRYAEFLEQKAAAIRAACRGEPIEFCGHGTWYPIEPNFDRLTNPYSMFKPGKIKT